MLGPSADDVLQTKVPILAQIQMNTFICMQVSYYTKPSMKILKSVKYLWWDKSDMSTYKK